MSKSYGNTIPLFSTDEEIKKLVMSIVTDSSAGIPTNVYEIHKLLKPETELKSLYEVKQGNYKELKEALAADLITFISPFREKREQIAANPEKVLEILAAGGERARARASHKMAVVRQKVGISR
jgi:tryptophanyl-tRNA synthetase